MWATSIGSTFAQRPVSGVRKSGIPDGTEIPAPVSTTVHPDPRISSARADGPETSVIWTPSARRRAVWLLAAPFGGALGEEGADALLGVGAGKSGREALLLGLDARVEIAVVGDRLDQPGRDRCLCGQLATPHQCRLEQLVVGDDAVDEADFERLLGQHGVADQVHLQGFARSDQAGQALGAAEAGDDPQLDL